MKIRPTEFITLSACSMILTALGIDMMLPAFAEVRTHFGLTPSSTEAAKIISFFFMGQIAQLFFGILSDRYGRLLALRVGFPLYILCGIAASFAPTLEFMFAMRFFSGVGASAVFTSTIAGVRDRFVGKEMARMMSLILTIFLFTPILAPFLGAGLLVVSNWQMVFAAPPLFAVIIFIWSFRLDESHPPEKRTPLEWSRITGSLREVLSNTTFLRYTAVATLLFTGLSSYISSSERIIGEIYGRPESFPLIFAAVGLLMSLCALLNSRLAIRYGTITTIRGLLVIYSLVSGTLLIATLVSGDPGLVLFVAVVAILMGVTVAVEPNGSAIALESMGERAGIASAVYGTTFFYIGASMGSFISQRMESSVFPLIAGFFVGGSLSLLLAVTDRRMHK